jgi:hypothetical protein
MLFNHVLNILGLLIIADPLESFQSHLKLQRQIVVPLQFVNCTKISFWLRVLHAHYEKEYVLNQVTARIMYNTYIAVSKFSTVVLHHRGLVQSNRRHKDFCAMGTTSMNPTLSLTSTTSITLEMKYSTTRYHTEVVGLNDKQNNSGRYSRAISTAYYRTLANLQVLQKQYLVHY